MDDQLYKEAMYSGFFDELGLLEKQQMFEKQAAGLGTLVKGFRQLGKDPTKALGGVRRAWEVGVRRGAGLGRGQAGPLQGGVANRLRQAWGGVKNVAKTPAGQAIGATALGAGALGAGAVGTGYAAGRAQG